MFSRTMFAGKKAGAAAHQKLIIASRKQITDYLPAGTHFPAEELITHFEGKNGPDGLLLKRSTSDEPCQFIRPYSDGGQLVGHIQDHIYNMRQAFYNNDEVKIAREAAWMSHMIIDGLTPAHHQPEQEFIKGEELTPTGSSATFVIKNLKKLRPGTPLMNHTLFEARIEMLMHRIDLDQLAAKISQKDLQRMQEGQFIELYLKTVRKIADKEIFTKFEKSGWDKTMSHQIKTELIPEAIKLITLGWLSALPPENSAHTRTKT